MLRMTMRVCLVTTTFLRWVGDWQGAFIWEAARAIARRDVQMRVIAMHSPGARTHEYMEGMEVFRPRYWRPEKWEILRKEGGGLPASLRRHPQGYAQILPFALVHTLAIAKCAKECDLIHAHWTLSAACASLGRAIHHRPVLATLQGSDVFRVTSNPIGAWLTSRTLLRCDRITALSRALVEATAAIGVPAERIRVIPNGVDTNSFVPLPHQARDDTILFVGSLIERKGVGHLLAAAAEVLGLFPTYRLVLIGEGPQYSMLERLADSLGIARRVVFLGSQSQDQVRVQMQRARLLVLPSLEEGQGVVLLEALACGTPVVASRVNGIPEVVTDDVGVLVPPADPKALSGAIRRILDRPRLWADMSRKARERVVRHYDWRYLADQYIAVYESMLQRPGAD